MLTIGQELSGRYLIARQIKEGGMGTVYEALDNRLNSRVAVKENLLSDEEWVHAFRHEAQFLANLQHPALPRVIDYFREQGGQYLVMEFIGGDDVETMLAKNKRPFPAEQAMDWARQLFDVLEYLHTQPVPVIHSDIKPANLKIKNDRLYLLDFGLAYGHSGEMSTFVRRNVARDGHTPKYSPIEQWRGEVTSPASDLYSLAATLYTLLAGRPPESADARMHAVIQERSDPIRDIRFRCPNLNNDVADTLMAALALELSDRPRSAAEMRARMFPPATPRAVRTKPSRGRRAAWTAVLAAVVALAVLAGAWAHRWRTDPQRRAGEYKLRAEQALENNAYADAIAQADLAAGQMPDDPYNYFLAGDARADWLDAGDGEAVHTPEVQDRVDRIFRLTTNASDAEDLTARGWANLIRGDGDRAVADASRALELRPGFIAALMVRGAARVLQRSPDNYHLMEGLADLNEVIRLRPRYAQAYANRGAVYAALGQYRLAMADYNSANQQVSREAFHLACADSALTIKEYAAAAGEYQAALQLNQRSYRARAGIGEVFYEQGDWVRALEHFALARGIKPTVRVFQLSGVANYNLERWDDAVRDFSGALELDPTNSFAFVWRAYANGRLARWPDAVADLSGAIVNAKTTDRDFITHTYRDRAEAFRRLGDEEAAQADDERARGAGN